VDAGALSWKALPVSAWQCPEWREATSPMHVAATVLGEAAPRTIAVMKNQSAARAEEQIGEGL